MQKINVLVVEDNPSDWILLEAALEEVHDLEFALVAVGRLEEAKARLGGESFDVVLLDLGLPDSQGLNTFIELHKCSPAVPMLVLTGLNDEAVGVAAIKSGAQDFLIKHDIRGPALGRSIRFAIERLRLQRVLLEKREKIPLRQSAAEEFERAVQEYLAALDQAFKAHAFKDSDRGGARLRQLADRLARLRASPRDVIDIHLTAMEQRTDIGPAEKSRAYFEEGHIVVLELMGELAGRYLVLAPPVLPLGRTQ